MLEWNTIPGMPATIDSIYEQALRSPVDDRMDLLERLILSSDEDAAIEAEQVVVADARFQEMREGKVKGVSFEDAVMRAQLRLTTLSPNDLGTAP